MNTRLKEAVEAQPCVHNKVVYFGDRTEDNKSGICMNQKGGHDKVSGNAVPFKGVCPWAENWNSAANECLAYRSK